MDNFGIYSREMTFDKKLIAINIVAFGFMILSYYFPFLRYFIFIPLLLTCVAQSIGWSFLKPKEKFRKSGLLQLVTVLFSTTVYSIALCYPERILYVCGSLLIFMGFTFFVGRTMKPEAEVPGDDQTPR